MLRIALTLATLLLSMTPGVARAGGLVVQDEAGRPESLARLDGLEVDVQISNSVATIRETRTYVVEDARAGQTVRFYRPAASTMERDEISLRIATRDVPAVVIDGEYPTLRRRELVRALREPGVLRGAGLALLESAAVGLGQGGYQAVQVDFVYREELSPWDTLNALVVPVDWQEQAVRSVQLRVNAHTVQPLRALYSPFHGLDVERTSEHDVLASYAGYDVCTTNDIVLMLSSGRDELRVDLLPFRYGDADGGYFMALLTPGSTAAESPRDLVFVVDTSGSMDGEKMEQARTALRNVIGGLSAKDRFTVIDFDGRIVPLRPDAQAASSDFVTEATAFVDGLVADGATNLADALRAGFDALPYEQDRPRYVVVLTDGVPTEGETDTEAILDLVNVRNEVGARVFAFGIGYDVNTVLLDRLALDSGGDAIYIRPGQPVDAAVEDFFASIASAALVDPVLDATGFGGGLSEMHPATLPDLFANQTVAVVGRYDEGGTGELILRGRLGGEVVTRRYRTTLPDYSVKNGAVPRVWAMREVGRLLQEIKLGDADPLLPQQATAIAARFGVVTEFTNFVLDEDGNAAMRYTQVPLDVTGSAAVETSASIDGYQNTGSAHAAFEDFVRYAGDRVFPIYEARFMDTSIVGPHWVDVRFASDRYFELVEAARSPLLAVARDLAVELAGVHVRVSDAGEDRPTEASSLPRIALPEEAHAQVELVEEGRSPAPAVDPEPDTAPYERGPGLVGDIGCTTTRGGADGWLLLLFAFVAVRRFSPGERLE